MLEELTLEQVWALQHKWWYSGLQEPIHKPKKALLKVLKVLYPAASTYLTSRSLRVQSNSVVTGGDIVFAMLDGRRALVELWWLCSIDDELFACVAPLTRVAAGNEFPNTVTYKKQSKPRMVSCAVLVTSAIFWNQKGTVVALVPPFLQGVA